ncbi:MAG TPA: hypothetical protein VF681_00775 [Abditibacteriaceae bacterium]
MTTKEQRYSETTFESVKEPYQAARAKCAQCGTELRYVPFALKNIMCRDCYGMDRYRRTGAATRAPEKPIEMTATDEEATTVTA